MNVDIRNRLSYRYMFRDRFVNYNIHANIILKTYKIPIISGRGSGRIVERLMKI